MSAASALALTLTAADRPPIPRATPDPDSLRQRFKTLVQQAAAP